MSKQQVELQIKLADCVYSLLPFGILAELIVFTIMGFVYWTASPIDKKIIIAWYAMCCFFVLIRFGLVAYYNFHKRILATTNKLLFISILCAVLAGLSWTPVGSVFITKLTINNQVLTMFILLGAVTVGNLVYSPIKYLYIFFLILTFFPNDVWLFANGFIEVGVMGIIYTTLMIIVSSFIHRLFYESLQLQFENTALVQSLLMINNELQKSEEIFRNALEYAPISMGLFAPDGKLIKANQVLYNLVGYSKNELAKMDIQKDLTHPDDLEKSLQYKKKLEEGKVDNYQIQKRYRHKKGYYIWVLVNASIMRNKQNKPVYYIVEIQNISDRIRNEEKLLQFNEQTKTAVHELKQREYEAITLNKMSEFLQLCITSEEAYPRINIVAKQLFPELNGGLSILNRTTQYIETVEHWGSEKILAEKFLAQDCYNVRSGNMIVIDDPDRSILCPHYVKKPPGGLMVLPMIVQGETIGLLSLFAPYGKKITKQEQRLAIIFNNNIKIALANIRLRELLREQSIRDPLTGLYNRRYLNEMLPHTLLHAARKKLEVVVAMLDLDFFKRFNDDYGHEAGDAVLKFLGRLLRENFRGSDIACRFGGEEFLIVLLDTSLSSAINKMQQFCERLKEGKLQFKQRELPQITASVGIAITSDRMTNMDSLIFAADEALYRAKELGRDRVEVYTSEKVT